MPAPTRTNDACLVADVGGTHARIGLAHVEEAGDVLAESRTYACAEHASLAAILADFARHCRARLPGLHIENAVVAIAGFLEGDRLVNANLPWPVSLRGTAAEVGLASLRIINDFEAVACAMPSVQRDALALLAGATAVDRLQAPALVLGPGTGLGAALCLDAHGGVLLSEAGHAALPAYDALQLQVARVLSRRWPHLDNERVLSGTGLVNLYEALAEIRGLPARWRQGADIGRAALAGGDALAEETLTVFCDWMGGLVADLALSFGARQVYLAGGVTGHIAPFLERGGFRRRYEARFAQAGHPVAAPVWRIEHGQLGLLGAAARCRGENAGTGARGATDTGTR